MVGQRRDHGFSAPRSSGRLVGYDWGKLLLFAGCLHASVYSASELAANEFPDLDVSLRGAVSIARRLQDPLAELVKQELIRYIPFPDSLKGKYQSFTEADISRLRDAGYNGEFYNVEQGVARYVHGLIQQAQA